MRNNQEFIDELWRYYAAAGRHDLPWRQPSADGTFDPYHIVVSEIMLQQTQVKRVIDFYRRFLERFPDTQTLASAELADVLKAWQGLGYNRRARYLHQAAHRVVAEYAGVWPDNLEELVALPGVGVNTAGAVLAYAYDQPALFVETNIRTVYIKHFFACDEQVSDKQIIQKLDETIDRAWPREFYWALMDYGHMLKVVGDNAHRRSAHYKKQSPFAGSTRQLRSQILRRVLETEQISRDKLQAELSDKRFAQVLKDLIKEQFLAEENGMIKVCYTANDKEKNNER